MKKVNFMAVAAGLLLLSAPAALFAEDTSDKKPADQPNAELREKLRKLILQLEAALAQREPM